MDDKVFVGWPEVDGKQELAAWIWNRHDKRFGFITNNHYFGRPPGPPSADRDFAPTLFMLYRGPKPPEPLTFDPWDIDGYKCDTLEPAWMRWRGPDAFLCFTLHDDGAWSVSFDFEQGLALSRVENTVAVGKNIQKALNRMVSPQTQKRPEDKASPGHPVAALYPRD